MAGVYKRSGQKKWVAWWIDDGDDCDDESFGLSSCGIPWVQPHPKFGLSVDNAVKATQILWGQK